MHGNHAGYSLLELLVSVGLFASAMAAWGALTATQFKTLECMRLRDRAALLSESVFLELRAAGVPLVYEKLLREKELRLDLPYEPLKAHITSLTSLENGAPNLSIPLKVTIASGDDVLYIVPFSLTATP